MNQDLDMVVHLRSRHLDLDLHNPIIDQDEKVSTLFLYTLSGNIIGYQQYRPGASKVPYNHPKLSRYYTYRKQQIVSMWGVESLYISEGPIFVCEGVFGASRFTNRRVSALAALCNDPPKDYKNWLDCIPRKKVVICDKGPPGEKLARLSPNYEIITDHEDIGAAPEDLVSHLINKWS
jgi:hypothetical protein